MRFYYEITKDSCLLQTKAWELVSFCISGWWVCEARWCFGSHFSWETWRENGQSSSLCYV